MNNTAPPERNEKLIYVRKRRRGTCGRHARCLPQKLLRSCVHSREGVDEMKRTEQGNKSSLDETMHECLCTEIVPHQD